MDVMRVRAIHTFPEKRGPAVDHIAVEVSDTGLAGDRPKKAAVSLVGADSPDTRANLVLDGPTRLVEELDGQVVRIGGALLALNTTGNHCAGLYAAVGESGTVRVGDPVEIVEDAR
jgi:uncharacterized protein YcbX